MSHLAPLFKNTLNIFYTVCNSPLGHAEVTRADYLDSGRMLLSLAAPAHGGSNGFQSA